MRARQRRGRQRTGATLLVVAALFVWSAGDAARASSRAEPRAVTAAGVVSARASTSAVPRACRTQSSSAWTVDERTTLVVPEFGRLGDLVVDRNGAATLAQRSWVDDTPVVRTVSLPAAPSDPQTVPSPPHSEPVPDGAREAMLLPEYNDHLGVDDSGALTTLVLRNLLLENGQITRDSDLVLSDRPVGGTWEATPHVADVGKIGGAELHVNASGAAVAVWNRDEGRRLSLRVSYRPAAGAEWTPAQPLAPDALSFWASGIDDSGRALVGYATGPGDIRFVTGTPTGGWSRPHRFPRGIVDDFAVGAGGHARVILRHGKDFDDVRSYTMSPIGRWSRGVRQPDTDILRTVTGLDAAGRATTIRWEKDGLVARTSDRSRHWRKPCVLDDALRGRRSIYEADDNFAVNSRGDAVVVYRTWDRARGTHLWASYKPVGQPWTEPIRLPAGATRRYAEARAAIGPAGHATVAWSGRNRKRITIVRMSPVP
jgi:hypothetical protein